MKKIISTILAFMMLVSCLTFTTVATAAEESKDNTKYIDFFSNMGVFNAVYENNSTLTRADFAQIMANLLIGDESLDSYRGEIYKDVPVEHIANKAINYMNIRGILNGKAYDMFYPDDLLTLNEACAGVIRALGYTSKADAMGFIRTATDLGALKGVTTLENGYITAGSLAKMLFNVLETPFVESYIHEGKKEENIGTRTLFADCLDLKKGYGMVTGVDGLYLNSSAESLENGQVMIGNDIYDTESISLSDYFGVYVDFYYRDDETLKHPEILAVISKTTSEEVVVYSDDISSVDKAGLTYYDEAKDKNITLKISSDAFVLYNGKSIVSLTKDYLPKNGYVRLISTQGKNSYDLIVVFDYQSLVVQSNARGKLSFKYGMQYKDDSGKLYSALDLSKEGYEVVIKNGDLNLRPNDIQIGNVVSIASNGDRYYVEVSSNIVRGVVKGYTSNPDKYLIVGTYYAVDPGLKEKINVPGSQFATLEMGLNSVFYIDFLGHIAGYDDNQGSYRYGYLKGVLKKGAFSDTVQVKILPEMEKEFMVYNVSKNCLVNGEKSTLDATYTALDTFMKNCEAKTTYNTNGKLTNIRTPIVKFKVENDMLTAVVTKTYELAPKGSTPDGSTTVARDTPVSDDYILISAPYAQKVWNGSQHYINFTPYGSDMGWVYAKNVHTIKVPQSGEEDDFETDYAEMIMPGTDNTTGLKFLFYDFDFENSNPALIAWVVEETGSAATPNSALYVVESTSVGDECAYLTLWSATGKEKVTTTSDDDVINVAKSLEKGDVVNIEKDSKGYVGVISKRFSYNKSATFDITDYTTEKNDPVTGQPNAVKQIEQNDLNCWLAFGEYQSYKLNAQGDNVVKLSTESYWTENNLVGQFPSTFVVFDGSEFYIGNINDLSVGDYVYCHGSDSSFSKAVVFKYDDCPWTQADTFHRTNR